MINEIKELYAFNTWANSRIYDAAASVAGARITQVIPSSFPSVQETLKHMLSAEWIWLQRWKGLSPAGMPVAWENFDFSRLRSTWEQNDRELTGYVDALNDADLPRVITYKNMAGQPFSNTLSQMLRHVVNHSTYHRGQVITMLRQLDAKTVGTDMILFFRERDKTR